MKSLNVMHCEGDAWVLVRAFFVGRFVVNAHLIGFHSAALLLTVRFPEHVALVSLGSWHLQMAA